MKPAKEWFNSPVSFDMLSEEGWVKFIYAIQIDAWKEGMDTASAIAGRSKDPFDAALKILKLKESMPKP